MRIDLSNIKIYTVLISLFYTFGIISVYYSLKIPFTIIITGIIIYFIFFHSFSFKKSAILFLIFVLGIVRANQSLDVDKTLKNITSSMATVKGQIISNKDISKNNNKVKFYLNVKEADFLDGSKENRDFQNLNSKILVSINLNNSIEDKISIGDYIELKGKFTTPTPATNPYQFNYRKYLLNNDCYNILYADPNSYKITKIPSLSFKNLNDSWYYILKKFENTRNGIILKHSKNIHSPELEILGGIVFGDETINPDEKIKENFKNSGLLHLLAASGLNVALIFGIWWHIAGLIKLPFNFSILIGAVFVILYTFMTGFPPSIIRASIMLLFVLFGKLIDRNVSSSALIFFVGFLILLFNPKMFFDIGFQLSFIVTCGLIICCPIVLSKFEKANNDYKEKYRDKIWIERQFYYFFSPVNLASAVFVPLIAQLFVIPLQMHYFNNLAPLSVLANIAVVPFIGILSFVGFISSIIALIPILNTPVVFIFDMIAKPMLKLLIHISEFFASLKISLITTSGMNLAQIFLFWFILLILILNIKNNFRKIKEKIILLIASLIFTVSFLNINLFIKNVDISMFDIKSSNCFLIKTPKNNYIMLNSALSYQNKFSNVENIIARYLKNERIKKLKFLIYLNPDESKNLDEITSVIKTENVILKAKNQEIYFEKDFKLKTFEYGKNSIIILLSYKDKNILFMDKYDVNSFRKIEKLLPNKIDIIKIPSKNNEIQVDDYIIERLKPDYVLISNNKISPKSAKLMHIFYKRDIKVIKSQDYGFVKIILNNRDINFYNFNQEDNKIQKIKFYNREDFSKSNYIKQFLKENL